MALRREEGTGAAVPRRSCPGAEEVAVRSLTAALQRAASKLAMPTTTALPQQLIAARES